MKTELNTPPTEIRLRKQRAYWITTACIIAVFFTICGWIPGVSYIHAKDGTYKYCKCPTARAKYGAWKTCSLWVYRKKAVGLSCPPDLAQKIIATANQYAIDPIVFIALVYSESSFEVDKKHSLPYVIGLCGVNTRIWHFTDLNVKTIDGNLEVGARILRHYLDRSKENYLQALWSYKGRGVLMG